MVDKFDTQKVKVLFISQWHPHRYDAMEGLFVRKHAEAVALYAEVSVLFVFADENIKKTEFVKQKYNSITEYYIYYPFNNKNPFYKIIKAIKYLSPYRKGFQWITKENFKPNMVHANILTRTPFIAYLYKILTNTPYVITEHWSRLLKSQSDFNGWLRKRVARKVVKNANCIMPVSEELRVGLEYHNLLLTDCEIVENVVDRYFYERQNKQHYSKKRLMNVNCFDEKAKNITGLLRVIKKLSDVRDDFEFLIVGTGKDFDEIFKYYTDLRIKKDVVRFTGELPEKRVADLMYQVDSVVQFSNYETAGIVIQEALVCGCPVISTKVGIATKYINLSNGALVDVGAEQQLFEAINHVLDDYANFDRDMISTIRDNFSYQTIGKKIVGIYKKER